MGEIADMMLDGTMCQVCGVWMEEDEPAGYPVTCEGCKSQGDDPTEHNLRDYERVVEKAWNVNKKDPKNVACPDPFCEKKFRTRRDAANHWVAAHET